MRVARPKDSRASPVSGTSLYTSVPVAATISGRSGWARLKRTTEELLRRPCSATSTSQGRPLQLSSWNTFQPSFRKTHAQRSAVTRFPPRSCGTGFTIPMVPAARLTAWIVTSGPVRGETEPAGRPGRFIRLPDPGRAPILGSGGWTLENLKHCGRRGCREGWTLLEIVISTVILLTLLVGFSYGLVSSTSLGRATREQATAREAARGRLEEMRATTFNEVLARFDADPDNDP